MNGGEIMKHQDKEFGTSNLYRLNKIKSEMGVNSDTKIKLAMILSCSRTTVAKKLSGKSSFTLIDLEKLAEHYGKPRNYFF